MIDTMKIKDYGRISLRLENRSDRKTVEQITYRAFRDMPPTGADDDGTEALLAHKMRDCKAFVPKLNYVAQVDERVVGNIMYTRCKVIGDDAVWETLTFGPVSVLPKYQRSGIGSALIHKTLDISRELGFRAVLIFGHESYYPRFGFRPASVYGITTSDGKNFPAFMALPLYDGALDGVRGKLILDDVFLTLDKEESDRFNEKLAEPMDVDEYISLQPEHRREDLQAVRLMLQTTLQPHGATEKISWGMPTYRKEQNLIHFAAQKNHLGIYPGAAAVEHFKPKLQKYKTSKGAIQFPYKDLTDEHLKLIAEIAQWCALQYPMRHFK